MLFLKVEQVLLSFNSGYVPSERSIAGEDAVAWNNDADRVAANCRAYCSYGVWPLDAFGELTVRNRCPNRDFSKRSPCELLKFRTLECNWNCEFSEQAGKILVQFNLCSLKERLVLILFPFIWNMGEVSVAFNMYAANTCAVRTDCYLPDGRMVYGVPYHDAFCR
jgi:hypothetical protein